MVHLRHLRVLRQVIDHLQRVLGVALDAQGQRLDALQQNPGIEWRDGSPRVAKDDGTDAGRERRRTGHVGKHDTVVAGIGLGDARIAVGIGLPVEASAVHYHAAKRRPVSADELRSRVNHDVCAVFERPDEERGEGIIHDEDDAMPVGDFGHALDVQHVAVGIAQGFCKDDFRVRSDGRFQRVKIVDFYDGMGNF